MTRRHYFRPQALQSEVLGRRRIGVTSGSFRRRYAATELEDRSCADGVSKPLGHASTTVTERADARLLAPTIGTAAHVAPSTGTTLIP